MITSHHHTWKCSILCNSLPALGLGHGLCSDKCAGKSQNKSSYLCFARNTLSPILVQANSEKMTEKWTPPPLWCTHRPNSHCKFILIYKGGLIHKETWSAASFGWAEGLQTINPPIYRLTTAVSDIDQTNINWDIRDGNWLSTPVPCRTTIWRRRDKTLMNKMKMMAIWTARLWRRQNPS